MKPSFSKGQPAKTETQNSAVKQMANNFSPQEIRSENGKLKIELRERDELIKKLQDEIDNLRVEYQQALEDNPPRKHNERRAGRKSKITIENAKIIARLFYEGHSFSEIADLYTQETGEKISKSTVDRVTKTYIFQEYCDDYNMT